MGDHRSLEAWKEARVVVLEVHRAARKHWRPWASALFSQLQRASLSVQLNIAEGWTFSRSPTCDRHLSIAYGSVVETADVIELLMDLEALPLDQGQVLREHCSRCRGLLVGLLKRRRPLA